jgi:hypothetical protein
MEPVPRGFMNEMKSDKLRPPFSSATLVSSATSSLRGSMPFNFRVRNFPGCNSSYLRRVMGRLPGFGRASRKVIFGSACRMNEYAWLLILPAALAMANFLPHAREIGSYVPLRRWLFSESWSPSIVSFWIAGAWLVHRALVLSRICAASCSLQRCGFSRGRFAGAFRISSRFQGRHHP